MSSGEYRSSRTVLISYFWKFVNNLILHLVMNFLKNGFWSNFSVKHWKIQVKQYTEKKPCSRVRLQANRCCVFSLSWLLLHDQRKFYNIQTQQVFALKLLLFDNCICFKLVCLLRNEGFVLQCDRLKALPKVSTKGAANSASLSGRPK